MRMQLVEVYLALYTDAFKNIKWQDWLIALFKVSAHKAYKINIILVEEGNLFCIFPLPPFKFSRKNGTGPGKKTIQ